MVKTVVKLWLEGAWGGEGRPLPYTLVEVEHRDFAAFAAACSADDFIVGEQLFSRWNPDERGSRIIEKRASIAFRGSAVRRMELPDFRLVDV